MVSNKNHNSPILPQISLENITIRANNRLCFAGANWDIHANEQWAVIGATGSGKSTLVKALSGHLPVVQGKIVNYFDGQLHPRSYAHPGEIILVSAETQSRMLQQYAGYHQARWQSLEGEDSPTVAEFLNGQKEDDRITNDIYSHGFNNYSSHGRLTQAITLLDINRLLDRKLIHLSNGEGRRVLLVRALARSPKLLILDDPFSGLDIETRKKLQISLTALLDGRQQRLLLITSRLEEIPGGITHVLCVEGHQFAAQGEKAVVLESSFVDGFFKSKNTRVINNLLQPVATWDAKSLGSPLIEMNHVSVNYQGVNVLQDITWTMKQGEHWAIRGPNGAGKSTLMSLILGDNPQVYANDVKIFGRQRGSGESIWEVKQQIGWVAPEIHLYYRHDATCQSVVCSGFFDSVGLYHQVTPEESSTAQKWMQILGIEGLSEQQFQNVSIGEQRLVLLARALVKQPRLLILDEPCQGLDRVHRERILSILEALCRQTPVSLLYITHHQDEIPPAVTHTLRLEQGRMPGVE